MLVEDVGGEMEESEVKSGDVGWEMEEGGVKGEDGGDDRLFLDAKVCCPQQLDSRNPCHEDNSDSND